MKWMQNKYIVFGLPNVLNNTLPLCEDCDYKKQHKFNFSQNYYQQGLKGLFYLHVVHSDICGPMQTQSLGGSSYFLTFIDDNSGFTMIYIYYKL